MSSAPSIPGVEVGASWLGGSEQVLTAGALELLAALHRIFGPRRAESPGFGVDRDAELAGRRCPTSWPGRRTCGRATGGRPRWPRVWSIAGSRSPALADRKMVISALDCGAKIFMAGFEDSYAPISGTLVTGQLNPGGASWRRYRRSPDPAASRRPSERPATSSPPGYEPAGVKMVDAALQAAEPPSGAAIRPPPSRSWSSSCTARRSWPRRGRMGEPMPVARIAQVLHASIHGVPAGRHLADALDESGRRVWHSTGMTALSH